MTDHDSTNGQRSAAPVPEIRKALVAGVRRHRGRTRRRLGGLGALAVGAAAIFGGLASQGSSPAHAAALSIESMGSWIEAKIVNSDAGGAEMTAELRDAGIDAEVRIIPTVWHKSGEWMGVQRVGKELPKSHAPSSVPRAPQLWNPNQIAAEGPTLLIHHSALRHLEAGRWAFYVGRAARQREAPQLLFEDGPREVAPPPK